MADRDTFVINTFSYIWRDSAEACLARLADQGFRRFEILLTAPHLWPADLDAAARKRLVALLQSRGLEIVSLNPGGFDNNLASPAADVRGFAQDYLRQVIDLAGELGAQTIVMSPGIGRPLLPPPEEHLLGWLGEAFDLLVPAAQAAGTRLCLENIPFTFLPGTDQIMAALDRVAGPEVGVVYDVANAVFVGEDPCTGIKQVASRLALIHLSDTGWRVWKHDPPGMGVVPFEAFGQTVRGMDCDVPAVLEIITDNPDSDIHASIRSLDAAGW